MREPMAALLDELSGQFDPGRIARPHRDVRFRAGKSPYKTACSASCGRVDVRLDVHHRRPVDCLQRVDFHPKPLARHDAGLVQADGVRPVGRGHGPRGCPCAARSGDAYRPLACAPTFAART